MSLLRCGAVVVEAVVEQLEPEGYQEAVVLVAAIH